MSKPKRGYVVLAELKDTPLHDWEAAWTGVFPRKRDAVRALAEARKTSPDIIFELGVVEWQVAE